MRRQLRLRARLSKWRAIVAYGDNFSIYILLLWKIGIEERFAWNGADTLHVFVAHSFKIRLLQVVAEYYIFDLSKTHLFVGWFFFPCSFCLHIFSTLFLSNKWLLNASKFHKFIAYCLLECELHFSILWMFDCRQMRKMIVGQSIGFCVCVFFVISPLFISMFSIFLS